MKFNKPVKNEFIIAYLLEQKEVGQRYTMWPLHITILPWFEAPGIDIVRSELTGVLKNFGEVHTKITERFLVGPRKKPAMLVEKTEKLGELHNVILGAVNKNGWPLKGRWTGELYKPHVTQKMGKDAVGEITIDKLSIVESQAQGYRQVVGEILL